MCVAARVHLGVLRLPTRVRGSIRTEVESTLLIAPLQLENNRTMVRRKWQSQLDCFYPHG